MPRSALLVSFVSLAPLVDAQDWRVLDGPHRMSSGAFDTVRSRVVTVGSGGDTREWDGAHWLHRPLPQLPFQPVCMAFDDVRRVVVAMVIPLIPSLPYSIRTWECDGNTWVQRTPATSPPLQLNGACVFDSVRGRTVFLSSSGPGGTFSTWEWDGVNWQLRPSPATLTGRLGQAVAYDAARGRTVMFGGLGPGGAFGAVLAETWEWDGASWLQRTLPVSPSARSSAAMAYDVARGVCVLFGGPTADTWEYDGITWTQRTGVMPPARTNAALVHDRHRARTVLFGGRGVPAYMHDVWEWDGVAWTQRFADTMPDSRVLQAIAYSTTRDRLVMFGGDASGNAGETWEWDGTNWLAGPSHAPLIPTPRISHAMWSDGTDVFVFGGNLQGGTGVLNDTWRWNGTTWTQVIAAGPTPRTGTAVTFDPITGGALLFGGSNGASPATLFGDTWRLIGNAWSQVAVSPAPSARAGAAIAADTVRQRVVLWGGSGATSSLDDTWEWDGGAWLLQNPAHRPPTGGVHSMAFEPTLGAVVLLTRPSFLSDVLETWIWTSTDWVRLDTPTRITPWFGTTIAAAPGRVFAQDGENLFALTATPPSVASYAAACPAGAWQLSADTWPRPGTGNFALTTSGHAANAPTLFVLGAATAALPIGSCTLRVQPGGPLVAIVASNRGIAALPVPLPPVAALVGLHAFAQVWSLEPGGLATTNAIDVTFGR